MNVQRDGDPALTARLSAAVTCAADIDRTSLWCRQNLLMLCKLLLPWDTVVGTGLHRTVWACLQHFRGELLEKHILG